MSVLDVRANIAVNMQRRLSNPRTAGAAAYTHVATSLTISGVGKVHGFIKHVFTLNVQK